MQSMIKREISLSITAHSELVRQLLLDGLEVASHRQNRSMADVGYYLRANAIYYRNMRQNGHTTALRTVYSSEDFKQIGVVSVFIDGAQREHFKSKVSDKQRIERWLSTENSIERDIERLRGHKTEILVLNDYISIDAIQRGWDIVARVLPDLHHLKLVVFLG